MAKCKRCGGKGWYMVMETVIGAVSGEVRKYPSMWPCQCGGAK